MLASTAVSEVVHKDMHSMQLLLMPELLVIFLFQAMLIVNVVFRY